MKFGSSKCVVLDFLFYSSFLTTWHFRSLMRLFRVPRAGFKGCTLAILLLEDHWSDESGLTATVNCTLRNRSASVLLCRSPCRQSASSDSAACRSPLFECVCSSLSLLVIVVFCFCFVFNANVM